jgi:hypothetical protein
VLRVAVWRWPIIVTSNRSTAWYQGVHSTDREAQLVVVCDLKQTSSLPHNWSFPSRIYSQQMGPTSSVSGLKPTSALTINWSFFGRKRRVVLWWLTRQSTRTNWSYFVTWNRLTTWRTTGRFRVVCAANRRRPTSSVHDLKPTSSLTINWSFCGRMHRVVCGDQLFAFWVLKTSKSKTNSWSQCDRLNNLTISWSHLGCWNDPFTINWLPPRPFGHQTFGGKN